MQKAKILSRKPGKGLEEVLKVHGLVAKKLKNFEERTQQIEVARAVEKAIHYRSQVLVVNHHLFFAHLASGEKILPPFEAVVFDEAHNLEEVAANSLGIKISHLGIRILLDSICNPRSQKGLLFRLTSLKGEERDFLARTVDDVKIANDNFFSNLKTKFKNENIKQRIKTPEFLVNWLDIPFFSLSKVKEFMKEASPMP